MAAETQAPNEFLKMFQTIIDGGLISQTVLVILGVMSIVSWFITITKMLEQKPVAEVGGWARASAEVA